MPELQMVLSAPESCSFDRNVLRALREMPDVGVNFFLSSERDGSELRTLGFASETHLHEFQEGLARHAAAGSP